jgi:thiol-disulfide isomerase/thioredoxin
MLGRRTIKQHPSLSQNNTKAKPIIVGKIYADWCMYCQQMRPAWKKTKQQFINNHNIKFISIESKVEDKEIQKINDTYLKNSTKKLFRDKYPTIFTIHNGNLQYYDGARDIKSLTEMIHKVINKSVIVGGSRRKKTKRTARSTRSARRQ